jgi:hypothetical protein
VIGYRLPGAYGNAPTAPPPIRQVEHLGQRGTFFVVSYPRALGAAVDTWLARRFKVDRAPIAVLRVERYRC